MNNLKLLTPSFHKQVKQELSRRNLIDFVNYTMPTFEEGWFNRIIAQELQQFYHDVVAGKHPRLLIQAPPRSGKSEMFSRRFPAWAFGQNPDLQIIAASYSSDLSSRMNRDVQRIIDSEEYSETFTNTSLNTTNVATVSGKSLRNSEIFEIVGHKGAYRSAGVGAGITGMGADIGIIDDPVKDAKEANSQTVRDSVWDWYTSTFYTRLSPNSGVLIGMTRWHEDDLAGRLLAEMEKGGDQWRVVSFPAIAENDEEFRKEGEALHPERYGIEHLSKIKRAVGTQTWNALYQQRPSSKGGDVIKRSWFRNRYDVLPMMQRVIIAGDTAQKVKQHNDYSVFIVAGKAVDGGIYIIDLIRGKWEAPELEQKLKDIWAKYSRKHQINNVYIEDKSSGTGMIQSITRQQMIPITGVQVDADKYTRVLGIQGHIEAGYIHLPEDAEWIEDFLSECEKFTATDSHKHDDQVDALVMTIKTLVTEANFLDLLG